VLPVLGDDQLRQALDGRALDLERAVRDHGLLEPVGDGLHREDLLLQDADDVVVEGGARDDVAARAVEVGSLIDHDRRIAGASADGALAAGHGGLDHRRAAGDDQQADPLMPHQRLGLFRPAQGATNRPVIVATK
jgi:hypothetical protein